MALSDFDEQKAENSFQVFDTDGDGVAGRSEIDLAAERAGKAFGHKPGSPAMQSLAKANARLWQLLAVVDTDNDDQITLAEYKAALPSLVANPSFAAALNALFDALVQIADGDDDGKLTRDEYVRLFKVRAGLSEDEADAAFDRIDSNGDGFVTAEELKATIREYYLDHDPDSSGSWLLGVPA
jgi:Ca2+-binding EF-hand superfamily protein